MPYKISYEKYKQQMISIKNQLSKSIIKFLSGIKYQRNLEKDRFLTIQHNNRNTLSYKFIHISKHIFFIHVLTCNYNSCKDV